MKMKMGLVYGGKSPEHNVSLQTAKAVIKALDLTKYDVHPIYITENGEWIRGKQLNQPVEDVRDLRLENGEAISPMAMNPEIFSVGGGQNGSATEKLDVVFPLLHGPNGEDGTVQGLLELLNIPYVGNGVLASAAGMDKVMMKNVYDQAGIKQPAYVWFLRGDWEEQRDLLYNNVEESLGYPCFVKPANLGSSVGISKARNRAELDEACATAFAYDRKIIVEEGIDGREIEMAVLGNDAPECSVVGEIKPETDFYDYKAKYEDGSTGLIIPAQVTESEYEEMKSVAVRSFKALDCAGLVRADFFLTEAGDVLMNEVNTMPGFTPVSMFPMLWQKSGLSYPELIEKLVQLGIERFEEKQKIKHTF
ncbi:D-alanine--D-alanine ligase [Salisediminibacterium halotolerans]|uniref:D-alanine--D-alanine ligase n=1 Tax=Salisediminibacterium halotolerans TaxID=517425 RepID=UPI000EB25472|nr:D-alanine--D-alanine ligase [Salisediminibacterium halotolerans]RLJ71664.1 D-alanine--D-alanine ligase [Actinophytocola xinjiangensis]RPE86814.1 D-alanine--D-alanine ligase [Salisediminibacterium halotolerans]TWG32877.1 D-alanine--D-alanine ligase [Salisediminibacterium halotolerans]GEL06969.1 D-alanine--D-alanine ligase [Salisediminibacterium halotolerans]